MQRTEEFRFFTLSFHGHIIFAFSFFLMLALWTAGGVGPIAGLQVAQRVMAYSAFVVAYFTDSTASVDVNIRVI
jgi:hypothetical protein